jgi:hypothetical protein
MSNRSAKPLSQQDPGETAQYAFNDVDATFGVNGFLVAVVGRRIDQTISTTTVSGDTSTLAFSENGIALYTLKIVFTDGTQTVLLYALRTA